MSTAKGLKAEKVVGNWLLSRGCKVVCYNWRNRFSEIDIVAKKNNQLLFVEVKYRSSHWQGSAVEYVTKKKKKQLEFAARQYLHENDIDLAFRIFAAGVNSKLQIESFVEVIY